MLGLGKKAKAKKAAKIKKGQDKRRDKFNKAIRG